MSKSSKRLFSMALALLLVVGAFIFYFNFVSPAYKDMETLKGTLASKQSILAQESTMIKQIQKTISSYKTASQAQGIISASLPSTTDLAGAITQIYGIAGATGMFVQSFGISQNSSVPRVVDSNSSSSVTLKPFGSLSFNISAVGSYESFKAFISDIETNIRIFDIQSVSISSVSSGQSGTAQKDSFIYNISVTTYYQQ